MVLCKDTTSANSHQAQNLWSRYQADFANHSFEFFIEETNSLLIYLKLGPVL